MIRMKEMIYCIIGVQFSVYRSDFQLQTGFISEHE